MPYDRDEAALLGGVHSAGYAVIKAAAKIFTDAEARGYERGVEEAAKVADAYGPLVAKAIRALLKPKGEAK